jgi:hypothetical protein
MQPISERTSATEDNTSAFRENCMRVPLCTNPFGGSTGVASSADAVAS